MAKKKSAAQRADAEAQTPAAPPQNRSERRQQELESLVLLRDVLAQQEKFIDKLSKRRFRIFLDALPLLIVRVATDQRVTFCNERYAAFAGVERQDLLKKRLWETVSHGYDTMRTHLFEAFDGHEVVFEQIVSSAQERYFHITMTPDFGPGEVVKGVFISLLDITDRKALEEQQRRLAKERAKLLKRAEEAGRIKDEFLAMLSHELRTPLTSIIGWSKLINSHTLTPERIEEGMAAIERNAQSQCTLIEELLDLARMTERKVQFEVSAVNMNELVKGVAESMQPAFSEKRLRLHLKVSPEIAPVSGDREKLQQVIMNVLTNALKFTPPGGSVSVEVKRVGAKVHIAIQDSGQGIPKDFLPHVFEPFRQADMSTTRKKEGLGLGLSIVHGLVEMHRGTIRAQSPGPGQGSTSVVTLPIASS